MRKKFERIQTVLRVLTASSILLVIFMSLLSPSRLPSSVHFFPYEDKVLHTGAYFVIAFLMILSSVRKVYQPSARDFLSENRRIIVYTFLTVFLLGVAIELLQPLTGRSMEFLDVIADTFGALAGIAAALKILRIVARRLVDAERTRRTGTERN